MINIALSLSNLSMIISFIIGILFWSRLDNTYKIVTVSTAIAIIVTYTGAAYHAHTHGNNVFIFNIHLYIDLGFMGTIALLQSKNKNFRVSIIAGMLFCAIIDVASMLQTGMSIYANWGFTAASILITVAFLFILLQLFSANNSQPFTKQSLFWLCMGTLIYYGCNVPVIGFLNYLIKYHPAIASGIFDINCWLVIIRYVCLTTALLLQRQRSITVNPARI